MPDRDSVFLAALNTSLELCDARSLAPERVNALGAALGFSEEAVYHHMVALQRDGLIQIEWGGRIALTRLGRGRLQPPPAATSIHLGANSTYVGQNAQVTGAVGQGARASAAVGPTATEQTPASNGLRKGELVAALVELRQVKLDAPPEEREYVDMLEQDVAEAVAEANAPGSTDTVLERRLESVQKNLERANAIGESGEKLARLARLLGPVVEWARNALG